MAFEQSDGDEVLHEINMTPLVDVMLVLLIVFIVTIPVVQHAIKVELPRATSSPNTPQPEQLQLTIDTQGRYFLGQQALSVEALESALSQQAQREPQAQLSIRGDQKVPYAYVAAAMAAAQRAGLVKIGFVLEAKNQPTP